MKKFWVVSHLDNKTDKWAETDDFQMTCKEVDWLVNNLADSVNKEKFWVLAIDGDVHMAMKMPELAELLDIKKLTSYEKMNKKDRVYDESIYVNNAQKKVRR